MDFNDTNEESEFRRAAISWLENNAMRRGPESKFAISQETGDFTVELAGQRAWQAKKFDEGFGAIYFPREFGGRGGTSLENLIYLQEESNFDVPVTNHFMIVNRGCAGLLLKLGTDWQKQLIQPALRSDHIWCQLFSEPGAGSDLAAVRTRATRDDNGWTVNGHKVWTSNAHAADWGVLIARTDADVPKHKGLTFFIVDMKSEGIEIRPIKQLTGASNFNEVYFDDLQIPDSNRIGNVNDGWKVAVTFLAGERSNIAIKDLAPLIDAVIRLAKKSVIDGKPAIEDGSVRERIASFYIREAGVRYTVQRMLTSLSRGQDPGPEIAVGKYTLANLVQEMTSFAIEMMHGSGAIMGKQFSEFDGIFQDEWLGSVVDRLGGGTDEILKNIVGERILGLPEDIRVDKSVAFKDLRVGS